LANSICRFTVRRKPSDLLPESWTHFELGDSSLATLAGRRIFYEEVTVHEQQIAYILRQAEEETSVEEVCRKAGISEGTYYNCRKKYGGLMPSEMKRLKQLDEENQRLKKLVADLAWTRRCCRT